MEKIDKRKWWNQLDGNWKNVFKKAISISGEPSDSDLEEIVNLQTLDCGDNKISDLKPLHPLTNLEELVYGKNLLNPAEIEKFKKAVPNCEVIYDVRNKGVSKSST